MIYQIRWAMEPGLRGISCCDFCATALAPGVKPETDGGVAVEFAGESERDEFLRKLEEYFASRRFTNAADAFDTVKAYAMELVKDL